MSTRKHATRSTGNSLLKTPSPSPPRIKKNTTRKTKQTTKGKILPTAKSDITSVAGILGYSGFNEMAKLSLTSKKIQAEMDENALAELVEENIRIAEAKKEAREIMDTPLPMSAAERCKIYYKTIENINEHDRKSKGSTPSGKRWVPPLRAPMNPPEHIRRKKPWNKGKFDYEKKIADQFLKDKINLTEFREGLVHAQSINVINYR
jgi:hypothetical protein